MSVDRELLSLLPTLAFFGLTYAITWTSFLVAAEISGPAAATPGGPVRLIVLAGVFAPSLVALALTAWEGGSSAVIALLRRLIQWRVPFRWYLFAGLFMVAVKLAAALIHRAALGVWPRFGHEGWVTMLAATILSVLLAGQAGEEIGWRGYALPRMASRFGIAWASVILGVLWACWHLPLFFMLGGDTQGQSFPLYLLQVTAISVAMAWLYVNANGSLLLTMLMHAAINNTKDIVPSATPGASHPFSLHASAVGWLTVLLLWVCAGYFLARMRGPCERERPQSGSVRHAM